MSWIRQQIRNEGLNEKLLLETKPADIRVIKSSRGVSDAWKLQLPKKVTANWDFMFKNISKRRYQMLCILLRINDIWFLMITKSRAGERSFLRSDGLYTLHETGNQDREPKVYYVMHCTHYTGTGKGNHYFLMCPSQSLSWVPCVWAINAIDSPGNILTDPTTG